MSKLRVHDRVTVRGGNGDVLQAVVFDSRVAVGRSILFAFCTDFRDGIAFGAGGLRRYDEQGLTWARGWSTKAAKALRAACAL